MNEQEILDQLRKDKWEEVEYFSNRKKEERERWTVSEFLSMLGVEYEEEELQSPEQNSKVDVYFRNALFQVKELTDPNCRRGKEHKDEYNALNAATCLDEAFLFDHSRDVPPTANMYELVFEMARELASSEKYEALKSGLDLLIYVTRTRASLIQPNEIRSDVLSSLGWRSVSCVNSKQAIVLSASSSAPNFIQEKAKSANQ